MYKTPVGKKYMYLRAYYLANKEKIAAKSAARYKRCRDTILQQHKNRHKQYKNTPHGRYTIAKQMGKSRGYAWTLGYEQFLSTLDKPCFYCGGSVERYGTGLDRVDSSLGYEPGNVRPCCRQCNQAKNNLPEQAFYSLIRRIYAHLNLEKESLAF